MIRFINENGEMFPLLKLLISKKIILFLWYKVELCNILIIKYIIII
jgi:hypothetical protein